MSVYGQFSDVYAPIMDGVGVVVQNYAAWLNRHGHRTLVVAPRVPDYVETDPFEVVRVTSVPLPPKKPYRVILPDFSPASRRKLDSVAFDLIHTHSPMVAGAEGLRIARRQGIPLVTTFHTKFRDDFAQITRSDWLAGMMNTTVMRYYDKVDAAWTVNESTARTMREYGYQGRIDIMPLGCDMVGFPRDPLAAAAFVATRFGVPQDVPVLLFVGQMAQVKNPMLVVAAVAELARTGAPHHLLMVGEGAALQSLRDQAAQLGIEDRVHFTGVLRDRAALAQCYTRASLFVFPSLYDNAPLVVREASAMACPSLLMAGSNAAEGIQPGVNGFLAESSDLRPFTETLRAALADPARLALAGATAQQTLAFSWESIVREVEARYAEIQREYTARPTHRRLSQR